MSKAEERALEKYPYAKVCREKYLEGYHQAEKDLTDKAKVSSGLDGFFYGQGYKQAEKDLELTWEDIKTIDKLLNQCVDCNNPYQEVLKRFKEMKGL
jgi:hypothetical protein